MEIGRLSTFYQKLIAAKTDRVLFHPDLAPKLKFKHRLEWRELKMMPMAFRFGTAFTDRPGTLSFIYDDQNMFGKTYHLAIKTTGRQHELWVVTFYRIKPSEVRRRMKSATIHWLQST